jgi:hypothetical protein
MVHEAVHVQIRGKKKKKKKKKKKNKELKKLKVVCKLNGMFS